MISDRVPAVLLLLFLTAAAFWDARCARIPNLLVLWAVFPGGFLLGPPFLIRLITVCALFYPLFRLRLAGAGDVKLLAACAAWLGADRFLSFLFFSLAAASLPALVLLLRGRRRARIPMGPFFLIGWALTAAAHPELSPVSAVFPPGGV